MWRVAERNARFLKDIVPIVRVREFPGGITKAESEELGVTTGQARAGCGSANSFLILRIQEADGADVLEAAKDKVVIEEVKVK